MVGFVSDAVVGSCSSELPVAFAKQKRWDHPYFRPGSLKKLGNVFISKTRSDKFWAQLSNILVHDKKMFNLPVPNVRTSSAISTVCHSLCYTIVLSAVTQGKEAAILDNISKTFT